MYKKCFEYHLKFMLKIKEFFFEFRKVVEDLIVIFKNRKKLIIWIILLPFNILITIFNVIFGIFYYIYLLIILIIKLIQKKLKYKNIKPIKLEKRIISFNNYILQTLHFITTDLSSKTAFLFLYHQLDLILNVKNDINFYKKIKNIFSLFFIILLKKLFYYLTSIPYFIIKNNNEITLLIYNVLNMNAESYEAYISIICLNIIKNLNLEKSVKTKKLKIKFNKKNIYLNPNKNVFDVIEKLVNKDKLVEGSNMLLKNGQISMINYLIQNKTINTHHPSMYFDIFNKVYNNEYCYLIVNQTTKKYLKINNNISDSIEKNKIKNELIVTGIINKDIKAYNVTPHLVNKNLIQLKFSQKLINNWYNAENWIKQFNFIQSFFINMDNKMYKVDKSYGLIENKNYDNFKNFLELNYDNFTPDIQKATENLIIFYDSNRSLFLENNNKLNFLKCLEMSEINFEIKKSFWNILNKKI